MRQFELLTLISTLFILEKNLIIFNLKNKSYVTVVNIPAACKYEHASKS